MGTIILSVQQAENWPAFKGILKTLTTSSFITGKAALIIPFDIMSYALAVLFLSFNRHQIIPHLLYHNLTHLTA